MAVQNAHVQQVHLGKFNKSHANYLWVIVSQSTMVDSRRVIHNHGLRLMILPHIDPIRITTIKKGDSPRLGTTSGFIEGWFHVTMDVSQETPMWMDESQFKYPGDGYLNLFLSGGNKHSLTSNFRVPRDRFWPTISVFSRERHLPKLRKKVALHEPFPHDAKSPNCRWFWHVLTVFPNLNFELQSLIIISLYWLIALK